MTDADADADAPADEARSLPGAAKVAGAIGAVLIVVLAVTTIIQGNRASDLRAHGHDRTAAERVAGEFAEALFTFQSTKPTANLDRLKELATTAYKPRVDAARKVAVTDQVPATQQLTSATHVTDVYLTELDGHAAHAITRGSWEVRSGSETAELALYLRIDLKKEHGKWKVDGANGITARPAASDTSSPSPTPSSTSTSTSTSTTSTTVSR